MLPCAMTTWEKLEAVPTQFWVNALLLLAAGAVALILVRHAANMNRYIIALIIVLLLSTVGFQWIYERNEPQALRPFINKIAPFFPSPPTYAGH